jgi:hypothetical protein
MFCEWMTCFDCFRHRVFTGDFSISQKMLETPYNRCSKNISRLIYSGSRVGFEVFKPVQQPIIEFGEKVMGDDTGVQVRK